MNVEMELRPSSLLSGNIFSNFRNSIIAVRQNPAAHVTCLPSARVRAKEACKNFKMGQRVVGHNHPKADLHVCMCDW
jgi:hypothetical protein